MVWRLNPGQEGHLTILREFVGKLGRSLVKIHQQLNPELIKKQAEPYLKVAKGMESQFAQYMVEKMNQTVMREKPLSSAESYYQSLLDHERTQKMVQGEGLGLQKMILKQIMPKHLQESLEKLKQKESRYEPNR